MKNIFNWFSSSNNFGIAILLSLVSYMQFISIDNTMSFVFVVFLNDT